MGLTENPNDIYDPEGIRRRRALTGLGISEEDTGVASQYAMSPEETVDRQMDNEAYSPGGATSAPASSAAADRYRATLGAKPMREDYQPSKLRRFGAALAGGLAGMRDARTGVEVATNIRDMPYQQAQQEWAGNVNRGAMEMGLEKDLSAQEVARRNAAANEQRAQAAERSAIATEHWRRTQEANLGWTPKTEAQATAFKKAGLQPVRPTAFQEFERNPTVYGQYQQGQRNPPDTQADKLARIHAQGNEQARIAGIRNAGRRVAAPKFASPLDMERAGRIAVEQVARTGNYDRFIITEKNGKTRPASLDELTKKGWFSDTPPDQETINDYYKFIQKVEGAKRNIMGQIRTPNEQDNEDGNDDDLYDLQYENEDQ